MYLNGIKKVTYPSAWEGLSFHMQHTHGFRPTAPFAKDLRRQKRVVHQTAKRQHVRQISLVGMLAAHRLSMTGIVYRSWTCWLLVVLAGETREERGPCRPPPFLIHSLK
jgi:hypothetical protein